MSDDSKFPNPHSLAAMQNQERIRLGAFRRSLKLLRKNSGRNPIDLCVIKDQLLGFVEELQKKYPFTFAVCTQFQERTE